jgi:hypothetical protein
MTFAEWVLIAFILSAIYYALRPIQKRIERALYRWLLMRGDSKYQAPVIDLNPFDKRSKKEDQDYEN